MIHLLQACMDNGLWDEQKVGLQMWDISSGDRTEYQQHPSRGEHRTGPEIPSEMVKAGKRSNSEHQRCVSQTNQLCQVRWMKLGL